jgi:hypothetical protein
LRFQISNDAQGLVTLELPITDLLGTWLAPERDPRDWQLRAQLLTQLAPASIATELSNSERRNGDSAYVLQESLTLPNPLDVLGLHLYLQGSDQQAWSATTIAATFIFVNWTIERSACGNC